MKPQLFSRRFWNSARRTLLIGAGLGLSSAPATAQAPTPTPAPAPRKVETPANLLRRANIALDVTPTSDYTILKNTPLLKEIDAELGVAYQCVGTGNDAELKPFWLGQADFLATGKLLDTQQDIYAGQRYDWSVLPQPVIPMAPPPELTPARLIKVGLQNLSDYSNPQSIAIKQAWDDIPSTFKDLGDLTFRELVDADRTDAKGRPLEQVKMSVSHPSKHFYWEMGQLTFDNFPQSATTQIQIKGGEDDRTYTGTVQINWSPPARSVWDIEIDLYDWVNQSQVPIANLNEWKQKLLEDEEFQKEILSELAEVAVDVIVQLASGGTGKVVVRVVSKSKVPASVINQAVQNSAEKVTARKFVTTSPANNWLDRAEVVTTAVDMVDREEGQRVQIRRSDKAEEELREKFGPRRRRERRKIRRKHYYLYTTIAPGSNPNQNPAPAHYSAEQWQQAINASKWPTGYYLSDLTPEQAATLREGEHSYEMFGHPYNWNGSPVYAVKINFLEGYRPPPFSAPHTDRPWGSQLYRIDTLNNISSVVEFGAVSFVPNILGSPGAADMPRGNNMPALSGSPQGTWTGARGDSPLGPPFKPVVAQVMQHLTGGTRTTIDWHNGYPDFSPFVFHAAGFPASDGIVVLPTLQHGTSLDREHDFTAADTIYANRLQWLIPGTTTPDTERVKNWRRTYAQTLPNGTVTEDLTWHHHEDMKTMILVFSEFNTGGNIAHQGGAYFAKRARM